MIGLMPIFFIISILLGEEDARMIRLSIATTFQILRIYDILSLHSSGYKREKPSEQVNPQTALPCHSPDQLH
jgi:hypothetical protein